MRRAPFVIIATVAGVVGLYSYHPDISQQVDTDAYTAGSGGTGAGSKVGKRVLIGKKPYLDYGRISVRAMVVDGKVTTVKVAKLDLENIASKHIAERSIPILLKATLATGDAKVDTVSGATFTSEAYRSSLQSAIDKSKA